MPSALASLLTLAAATALPTHAPDPLRGAWHNPDGSVAIRVDDCGARLCGTVTRASADAIADSRDAGTQNLVGTNLFRGYRRDGPNHWSGTVFVPDLGHSFSSHIVLIDYNHARISGCLLGRFLCQAQVWQRQ